MPFVTRYFQLYNCKPWILSSRGRYNGQNPKQAASKCASKLFKYFQQIGAPKNTLKFNTREVTRGSHHKIYSYEATKILLPESQTVNISFGGQPMQITFKYRIKIKKIKKNEVFSSESINFTDMHNQMPLNIPFNTQKLSPVVNKIVIEI